jgi:hypothetical protein
MIYRKYIVEMFLALQVFFTIDVTASSLENLKYELISTSTTNQEPSKWYRLSFPRKMKSSSGLLMMKDMNDKFVDIPVFIDEDGNIWSQDKTKYLFGMGGGYGERFEMLLAVGDTEKDLEPIAKCVIIPFPRFVEDKQGRRIEIQADTPDGDHFTIVGSGFAPKEVLTFKSRSCDETLGSDFKVDENGGFCLGYAPAVIGKKEGPFEVTFSGKNMEPLKLRHYWGRIAFTQPNKYKELESKYSFSER